MTHPSSLELEAFACGETARLPLVAEHLAECGACKAFVQDLGGLAAPAAAQANALVARALQALGGPEVPPLAEAPPLASITRLERVPATKDAGAARARSWRVLTSIAMPLAAAAAILVLLRSAPRPPAASAPPSESAALHEEPIQMATGVTRTSEPDTTFKGGLQLAVVRERGGQQERFASGVKVRPGDRLRVEVALDREQAILGAVLADDGSYLELMPLAVRGPGTHFSEKSAKIDQSPSHGTIVIGTPEAVARARATHQLDGVATLRVEGERP